MTDSLPLAMAFLTACSGTASSPFTPASSASDTALAESSAPADTSTGNTSSSTGDTSPSSYTTDTFTAGLTVWESDRACWAEYVTELDLRHWDVWLNSDCSDLEDNTNPLDHAKYWLKNESLCMDMRYEFDDACPVSDPNVRPCSEAPFDCCGLPDATPPQRCNPRAYEP